MNINTDFQETYNKYLQKVEQRLAEYVPVHEPVTLYQPFKYLMAGGGKRLRPLLVLMSAGAVGGLPDDAIDVATSVEILHNFTLVHDDIMDRSPIRRGRQTVHLKWNEAAAILTGDVMIGYAYRLLPSLEIHSRSHDIFSVFTNGLIEVCEGQSYDTENDSKVNVTLDDYFLMIDKKTAKLLETAALIGGHFGKASGTELEALRNYAHGLGIAFQVQDDLLDLTAEQIALGKKIGQDIIEGKKTYLFLRAQQKATDRDDRELLNKFILYKGLPENEVQLMLDLFIKLDILTEAQTEVDKLLEEARSYLSALKNNYWVEMLSWLTTTLNKRKF